MQYPLQPETPKEHVTVRDQEKYKKNRNNFNMTQQFKREERTDPTRSFAAQFGLLSICQNWRNNAVSSIQAIISKVFNLKKSKSTLSRLS